MAARRPKLQEFDRAAHRHCEERQEQPVASVGKPEGKTDQDKRKRMLAVLPKTGMGPIMWRSEGRKGDGCGEGPGNEA